MEIWAGTGLLWLQREMLLDPELPSKQGDRHHIKKPSSSSVSSLFVLPLDSDMWFSWPQRPLLVYSNVRDQAHHLHLPKRIQFPHRFQITAEGKGCLVVSLSSTKEHGNTKSQQFWALLTTFLRKNQFWAAVKEIIPHWLPEIHWFPLLTAAPQPFELHLIIKRAVKAASVHVKALLSFTRDASAEAFSS